MTPASALRGLFLAFAWLVATSCSPTGNSGDAGAADAAMDKRAREILAGMSLDRKIAQLVMPDISTITPEDVERYRFGVILNGGNSGPGGNDLASAEEWLKLADAYWDASSAPMSDGQIVIPALWATDALHGHNNVPGATVFPHNIGLGATRDPDLLKRIGEATAAEVAVTGIDWTFAPTLAVTTDIRWGRTYESFSSDPELVSELGGAVIEGLQGAPGSPDFLDQSRIIATAKHFFADGGTRGKDRGDAVGDMEELKRVHVSPYRQAFAAGVGSVMASFSSVNGQKMHASEEHLTGLLRGELGFKGPVVGDWNGHGELEGCTNADCPASLMAGLDVYMVPEDWKGLYETLLAQAKDGRIPLTRIDEAVLRVLRLKLAYGLFDKPRPSERQLAGDWERLGSDEHRELAREAVRKSLVLLKNNGVLPISASAKVLVAGPAADDVPRQTGGWSITWQGGGTLANADFRGSTSIFQGLSRVLSESGGTARLSVDGSYQERPDLAIVVFGEEAYAEFVGDRDDHVLRDEAGLRLLRRFKAEGIPTVAVLVSGRPLWSNRELALADAFVAAWLPGSEGTGVADVLVATQDKKPRYDFSGRLSFAWPKDCTARSEALFPLGAGGSYAAPPGPAEFDTACSLLDAGSASQRRIFERGLDPSVNASAEDAGGPSRLANLQGASPNGGLSLKAFDLAAQEDARRLVWSGPARLRLEWGEASLPEDATLVLRVRVPQRPSARLTLSAVAPAGASKVDLTSSFELAAGKDWRNLHIPVTCVGAGARGVTLEADAAFSFDVERISLVPGDPAEGCAGPF
jgi:beta-glucosidase